MGMRGNALDGLGASIMTKYFNKTELVSMPLDGLSLSKAKKTKKKHYLCFNALARAKSITEWKHWTFPKKSFNALTRAKPIPPSGPPSPRACTVSMPSHGLSLSTNTV